MLSILLILFLVIGSVSANDLESNSTVRSVDDVSMDLELTKECSLKINDNTIFQSSDESYLSNDNESKLTADSDVIVVENWNELKYYCSLTDKDYTLKLKENTNFYPSDTYDKNQQIKIKNNVKIIGSEGSWIGDSTPEPRHLSFLAIEVEEGVKLGLTLDNVTFKWIEAGGGTQLPEGIFIKMAGKKNNVIKNCRFESINMKVGHSCIVYLKKGTATLQNCSFIKCRTNFGCVSIYDPNSFTSAHMIVKDCYFENNYASTEPGCINNCGIVEVYNTTFYKNEANSWAGAIHTHYYANTTIYNSHFIDNLAGWNGGALYTYSWLQIYNSTFIGNNCTTNNGGGAIGACKYESSPHIYIENTIFANNQNKEWSSGRGGAISIMDDGTIEVLNSTFIENSAKIGSAICAWSQEGYGSPSVIISGNKFINHTRTGDVLNVRVEGTPADISNNYYLNNSIVFSTLTLESLEVGNDKATLKITNTLANPSYYDEDILNKTGYDIYVDGKYVKTVDTTVFDLDFGDLDICDVYAIPTIGNSKTNTVTLISTRAYIFVSKETGNDANNGLSRDTPVSTLSRAIELAQTCKNILIMDGTYDESNLIVNYDLNIKGEGNATITGNNSCNLFEINTNNFSLKNVIVENLSVNNFIKQNNGQNVEITKVIFKNNIINSLFHIVSGLNVSDSILINNSNIVTGNLANVDLDHNWWGNTKENYNNKPNSLVNNWLFLNISTNDNNLELNEKTVVNIDYDLITKDGTITKESVTLPKIDLNISSVNGAISRNIVNPPDKITYTLNSTNDGLITATYNGITSSLVFNFIKTNPIVNVNVEDVYVGSEVVVEVSVPNDATGTLTINTGNITQVQNITSNKIIFILLDLPADDYTLKTIYSGDNHYKNTTTVTEFKVNKFKSTTTISVGDIKVHEDVLINITVPSDATGNVIVIVNGNEETLTINNSQVKYTIKDITRGDYIIQAIYTGNSKYLSSNDSFVFDVDKLNTTFTGDVENIVYGEDTVIRVVLNDNATGTITAKIDDKTNTSNVIGGRAEIILSKVDVGVNKTIYLYYSGDNTYLKQNYTLNYTVSKADLKFNLSVSDVMIGKDVVVILTTPTNVGGTFTITCIKQETVNVSPFGETEYSISDLGIGEYDVNVEYNGNNYKTCSESASFNVNEYPTPVWQNDGFTTQNTGKTNYTSNIREGIKWINNITTTENMVIDSEGNIYLINNNTIYSYDVNGTLRWVYARSGVDGSFSGLAVSRDVIIAPKSGDTLYFINQTSGLKYGYSNIYQASSEFAPIVDENSNIYIMSEYQYDSSSYYLVIVPYKIWEYGGTPTIINLGNYQPLTSPTLIDDNLIVVLSQSRLRVIDLTTSRTILTKSGTFNPVRPVVDDGKNIYTVQGNNIVAYSVSGSQLWKTVTNDGVRDKLYLDNEEGALYSVGLKGNLYKYDIFTGMESLVCDLTVTSDILIGEDGSIYFGSNNTIFALNKNGEVLWKSNLDSTIINSLIMDNRGIIYLTTSDKLYALSQNPLKDSNMTMQLTNIYYGADEVINVSLDCDATGNITFKIIGENYNNVFNKTIENGSVIVDLKGLDCGNYVVEAYYAGDDNFKECSLTDSFDVLKVKTRIIIDTIDNLDVIGYLKDENGNPIINMNVTCSINDNTFSVLTDADGRFKVTALSSCSVKFEFKNDNYGSSEASIILNDIKPVRKATEIEVDHEFTRYANDYNAGERGGMFYFILKDGEGNILVNKTAKIGINGVIYTVVTDSEGKSGLQINLAKSTAYTYAIAYLGDDNYNASFAVSKLNLIQKPLTITPKKTSYTFTASAKNKYVEATLTTIKNEFDGKMYLSTGKKVTLTVNGKTYTASAGKNGAIKFNIGSLTKKGTYKVTIRYAGDATYEAATSKQITIKIS